MLPEKSFCCSLRRRASSTVSACCCSHCSLLLPTDKLLLWDSNAKGAKYIDTISKKTAAACRSLIIAAKSTFSDAAWAPSQKPVVIAA